MDQIIDFFVSPYANASIFDIALEIVAAIFGVLSVIFAKRGNIWVFPTGIVSTAIYIYITFIIGYYGDFIINIYYTVMSIYGWILWSKVTDGEELKISWADKRDWQLTIAIFIFTILFVTGVYLYFDKFESILNYFDVLTTGLAFASMWLMAKKKVENWIGWIITDLISVPLYFAKGLGFSGIQFTIFLVLAIQGYIMWRNSTREEKIRSIS